VSARETQKTIVANAVELRAGVDRPPHAFTHYGIF